MTKTIIATIGIQKEIIIEMKHVDVNGTSLQGYLNTSYKNLVSKLGKQNAEHDDYKVDAEWHGTINNMPFTIYNYKDGRNYCGKDGLLIKDMTDWHIGGHSKEVAELLTNYFNS